MKINKPMVGYVYECLDRGENYIRVFKSDKHLDCKLCSRPEVCGAKKVEVKSKAVGK